jgi:hypothetical protein
MKYKIGIGVGCKAHYFSKPWAALSK